MIKHDESQAYLTSSISSLENFVKQFASHENYEITIEDHDFHPVQFGIHEEFHIYVVAHETCFAGTLSPSEEDTLVVNDDNEFESYCSQLLLYQQSSDQVVETCKATILSFDIAQFMQRRLEIPIHQSPHRIIHHCSCEACLGNGEVACPSCHTTQYEQCTSCHGHGEHSCHHCGGSGYQMDVVYERDFHGNIHRQDKSVPCYCNNGSYTCASCGGCGEVPCTTCSDGYIDCENCDATGWISNVFSVSSLANYKIGLSDITNSVLERINRLSGTFIEQLGFSSLQEGHVRLVSRSFSDSIENNNFELVTRFEAPAITLFSSFTANGDTQHSAVKIFGDKYFVLDADYLLEPLVSTQLEDITKLRRDLKKAFTREGRNTLYHGLTGLLESPIAQEVLNTHVENQAQSHESIARSIRYSISPDLVGNMILNTKTLFSLINLWRFTRLTLISVTAYIMLTTAIFFTQRVGHHESLFTISDENIVFNFSSLIYFPCVHFVILLFEILLNRRRLQIIFDTNASIARKVQARATLGTLHSRYFIGVLLFLVLFFVGL